MDAGDARVNDAPANDAPILAFCASLSPAPAFCADFDEGSITVGWDGTDLQPDAGSVSLDTQVSSSPPASFLGAIPAIPMSGHARLSKDFPVPHAHVVFSFDARIDAWGPTDDAFLFSVYFNEYRLRLYPGGSGPRLEEWLVPNDGGSDSVVHSYPIAIGSLVLGTWYHSVIDVSGTPPGVTLTINGAAAFTNKPVSADLLTYGPLLYVGPYEYGNSAGWQVHYDNVVFDFPP